MLPLFMKSINKLFTNMNRRNFIQKTSLGAVALSLPLGLSGFSEKPELTLNIVESFYISSVIHFLNTVRSTGTLNTFVNGWRSEAYGTWRT